MTNFNLSTTRLGISNQIVQSGIYLDPGVNFLLTLPALASRV